MLSRRLLLVCCCLLIGLSRAAAQGQAAVSLNTAITALQTGQKYDVTIMAENAPEFWSADVRVQYEPKLLYVIGTKSGSPIHNGDLFGLETSVVVQNVVRETQVSFVVSKVGETPPANGTGVIGTFQIYPLAPGKTQLTFSKAQLVGLTSYDPNASNVKPVEIQTTTILLDLTITGSPVPPPDEATATPRPTDTPTPASAIGVQITAEPTQVNVTRAPVTPVASGETGSSLPLVLAVAVTALSGLGLVALLVWRRRR
jgi:hypothetical protein